MPPGRHMASLAVKGLSKVQALSSTLQVEIRTYLSK